MRKIYVIAAREYLAAVRTKAFLLSLVFMPVLMASSVGVQVVLEELVENRDKRFAVIDRTPAAELLPALEAAAKQRKALLSDFDLKSFKQGRSFYVVEGVEPSADTPAAIEQ